jgi:Fe-S oxidoreductase
MPGGPATRKGSSLGTLLGRFLAHFEVRNVCSKEVALIKPTHRNGWLRPQIEAKLSRLHPECPDHRELRRLVNRSLDLLVAVEEGRFDPGPDWAEVEPRLLRALAYLLSAEDAIPDHLPDGFDDDMREFQSLANHAGVRPAAVESARKNIEVFQDPSIEAIIINAAGCGSTLKEYGHLLHDDPQWKERAENFSAKVKDLTEWLLPLIPVVPVNSGGKVTYHDACHLAHAQRISKPPRALVRAVAGPDYVELPESDVCCGSAGTYNLTEPAMAERLQERKTNNILSSRAKTVVTTNPGCLLQIRAGLKKAGAKDVRAVHIADYLEEAFKAAG